MRKLKSQLLRQIMSTINGQVAKSNVSFNPATKHSINRRNFIALTAKSALAASASMAFSYLMPSCKVDKKQPKAEKKEMLDVAILGGGMAGLNCANYLLPTGLSFKVFEASKRLGGRILTHYNDSMQLGIFPEFGGDFIDSDHQDMLDLAREFNLEIIDLIKEQEENGWIKDIYFYENRKISEKEVIREFNKIVPQLIKDKKSLGDTYKTEDAIRLDNTPLSSYLSKLKCKQWLKDLLDSAFVAEFGLNCQQQSTLNMLDLIDTNTDEGFKVFGDSDERFRIKGGNSLLIQKLSEKISSEHILLNYQVNEVIEAEDSTYQITFDNGESIKAKTIVCTIPFTILRNLKLNLLNMTEAKRQCIAELGYGNNTKLVLGYEGQPWRSKENNAMGYLFASDITNGWDASLNKTENNPNGAYVAFFGGSFSQKMCDESFKNPNAPPSHLWRTELPEKRVDQLVATIDKVFKHSKEKFKNKHVFVNWIEYPYVKASYTCYKVGQWTTLAGLEAQPIGNFFFAGEHCSAQFQGFMNGAAESGRLVAQSVAKVFAPSNG
ncbi:MAG: FAD-dependent oxidoreductase [Saprospiraceae bacterium]|nr:FAD-dependent oxidoreductase [Saprospiraceae bacterium]